MKYKFSDYEFDDDLQELRLSGRLIPIEPQVFALLRYLIENRDHVATKDELIEHVWRGRIVSDATLTSRINLVRQAVGDSGKLQHTIRTYPKRGFRFVADATSEPRPRAPTSTKLKSPSGHKSDNLDPRSVMVAPLENQTGQGKYDYFASGLAEELSIALGRLKWLRVIPFGSVLSLCADGATRLEIARTFAARYALEGSVRRVGDRVRITIRLTDCEDDRHLWGDHFVSDGEHVFELLNTLAGQISAELGPEIIHAEVRKAERRSPASFEVWDHYLRALTIIHLVERVANEAALQELEAAIALDPNFAPAHSQLAWCCAMVAIHGWSRPGRVALSRAKHHAELAVSLDPYDPMAFCAMSIAHFWQGDQIEALTAAKQAAELDRGSQIAQGLSGCIRAISGSPDTALQDLAVALQGSRKDPFRWFWIHGCANACFALERYDEACDWARQVIELRPSYVYGHVIYIASSNWANRTYDTQRATKALLKVMPNYCINMLKSHPIWSDEVSVNRLVEGLAEAGVPETSATIVARER